MAPAGGVARAREYDLLTANQIGWVRGLQWFRIGFGTFSAGLLALVALGVYDRAAAGQLGLADTVGGILIFFILGVILVIAAVLRSPAIRLVLDDEGLRLVYRRGRPYCPRWNDARIDVRGRWTPGARDSISGGRPRYSVYGRFKGLTESFIPQEAFVELRSQAIAQGLRLTERPGNPGWTLYRLSH